jgi:hypothetical protein
VSVAGPDPAVEEAAEAVDEGTRASSTLAADSQTTPAARRGRPRVFRSIAFLLPVPVQLSDLTDDNRRWDHEGPRPTPLPMPPSKRSMRLPVWFPGGGGSGRSPTKLAG